MSRKKRSRKWDRQQVGYCRNCSTVYLPPGSSPDGDQVSDVLEMEYCEACALRCPHCQEWLTKVEAEVLSQLIYDLHKDDDTGKFTAWDEDYRSEKVLRAACPRCGRDLDTGLLQF